MVMWKIISYVTPYSLPSRDQSTDAIGLADFPGNAYVSLAPFLISVSYFPGGELRLRWRSI